MTWAGRHGFAGLLGLVGLTGCAHLPELPCNTTREIYALGVVTATPPQAAALTKIIETRICHEDVRPD